MLGDLQIVALLDQEITEEILEKTAKVEKRQKTIQTELRVSFILSEELARGK